MKITSILDIIKRGSVVEEDDHAIHTTVRWEGPFNEAKDDVEMYCIKCDENLDHGAEDWNYCPNCGLKLIYR